MIGGFLLLRRKILFIVMSKSVIRILVIDDHEMVRKSIMALLSVELDMQVIGTAENGRKAVQLAKTTEPDVIVMDISMPELDGIRAAGEIQALATSARVIILSMYHDSVLLQQARKNGASGFILKQQANQELVPAIRAASKGELSL
ncbi:MAG: response regulator transcription factor [Anaerolinea sp.]|nr:response regulator transcription factor [Anaerolinea sp.]